MIALIVPNANMDDKYPSLSDSKSTTAVRMEFPNDNVIITVNILTQDKYVVVTP